jgi:hypothetical protein
MSSEDPRIVIIQQKLAESKIHPAERDALADDLRFAQEINGDTAPVMQTLKTMLISGVRRELLAHERTDRHFSTCLVASQVTKDPEGRVIYPWERNRSGSFISFSLKEGIKATGISAVIASIVITAMAGLWGLSWWQTSKERENIQKLLQERGLTKNTGETK